MPLGCSSPLLHQYFATIPSVLRSSTSPTHDTLNHEDSASSSLPPSSAQIASGRTTLKRQSAIRREPSSSSDRFSHLSAGVPLSEASLGEAADVSSRCHLSDSLSPSEPLPSSSAGLTLQILPRDAVTSTHCNDTLVTPRPQPQPQPSVSTSSVSDLSSKRNGAAEEGNRNHSTSLHGSDRNDLDLTPSHNSQSFAVMQGFQDMQLRDSSAERTGRGVGINTLGASTDVSHLGLGLGDRRGSSTASPSMASSGDEEILSKSTWSSTSAASGQAHPASAPPLSKSSLFQIGMVEGITPPAMSTSAVGTSSIEVSSVVAAGLEMGLGVNLAASALMNHIPGAGSAAMSGLAEPRYSRPHPAPHESGYNGASGRDEDSPASSPLFLEEEASTAATYPQGGSIALVSSPDSPEFDLQRRRTTGTRENKMRFEPPRGSRHHRADTHDPILTQPPPSVKAEIEKQQYYQNNYISLRNEPKISTNGLPSGYMLDAPLSATTSLGRESSLGDRSSSTHAHASVGDSTQIDTPSLGEKAILSPDGHVFHAGYPFAGRGPLGDGPDRNGDRAGWKLAKEGLAIAGNGPTQAALLGLGGGSHFGPGVRAKVSEVLPYLVSSIPLTGEEGETITIAEYGSLNTRSINLMQPIISSFVEKAHADTPRRESVKGEVDDYFPGLEGQSSLRSILGVDAGADYPCTVNFSIIHEDSPQADFRPLSQMLETVPESYLHPQWQSTHEPSLQNVIFPSFVARPFASRIAPPSTIHLGISLMDLHWSHTPRNPAVSLSTSAHAELTAFLTARANEFKKDGVIVMAYIARSEDSNVVLPDRPKSTVYSTSPLDALSPGGHATGEPVLVDRPPFLAKERTRSSSSPNRSASMAAANGDASNGVSDIWTTLTNTLAPCIQRLVSCGMLKSDVARHLLSLPMHARTPRQTRNVLKSVKHLWKVEWSCGLGDEAISSDDGLGGSTPIASEPEPLRLPHPAWKALQAGTLSRVAFAEHMIQLFKNLYESHFRVILREKGKLSKGAVEFVLDSLWDVLQSRIDDQEPCPIAQCELEVQLVALRRK